MMEFEVGGVKIGFSSLLVCMMLGTVFCNVCDFSAEIMDKTDRWTAPLYILFFVLSGAGAGIERVQQRLRGADRRGIYPRACVRQVGGREHQREVYEVPAEGASGWASRCCRRSVALGMSVTVAQTLGADGAMVRNIVLFGVLIYELVGPALTRIALTEAGDIQPKAEAVVSADD